MPITIEDPTDERISDYHSLTELQLRSRLEPAKGLFIAEGELVIRRAAAAGYRFRSMLVDAKRVDVVSGLVDDDVPLYAASPAVLESITGFAVHRGILASVYRPPARSVDELLAGAQRLLVLEDLNNHTNLGAIFRSAAALGMDGVLLSPSCVDPLYRRCVRVSMGEVFAVPYAWAEEWPGALERARNAGFSVIALTPAEGSVALRDVPQRARRRPALVLGAEGPGLTAAALAAAEIRARIPMHNAVDSLNVAAAAAIACYEFSG